MLRASVFICCLFVAESIFAAADDQNYFQQPWQVIEDSLMNGLKENEPEAITYFSQLQLEAAEDLKESFPYFFGMKPYDFNDFKNEKYFLPGFDRTIEDITTSLTERASFKMAELQNYVSSEELLLPREHREYQGKCWKLRRELHGVRGKIEALRAQAKKEKNKKRRRVQERKCDDVMAIFDDVKNKFVEIEEQLVGAEISWFERLILQRALSGFLPISANIEPKLEPKKSTACPVCWVLFNQDNFRQIISHCGHSICLSCLKEQVSTLKEKPDKNPQLCSDLNCFSLLQIDPIQLGDSELELQFDINEHFLLSLARKYFLRLENCPSDDCPNRFYAVNSPPDSALMQQVNCCYLHEPPLAFCQNCWQQLIHHRTDKDGHCLVIVPSGITEEEELSLNSQGYSLCPNPKCQKPCMRISGCKNVTCEVCGMRFQIPTVVK